MRKINIILLLSILSLTSCSNDCDKYGHNYVFHDEVKAKFDKEGNIKHYTCSSCGKYFDEDKNEVRKNDVLTHLKIFDYCDSKDPITLFGNDVEITFDFDKFDALIAESNNYVSKINSGLYNPVEVNNCINKILSMLNEAAANYDPSTILADATNTPESHNIKNRIYNAYYDLYDAYYAVYVALAKDGTYNSLFFTHYTEQQIQQFIVEHSPSTGGGGTQSESTEKKMQNLLDKYLAGELDSYSAYKQYTVLSHDLASERNANNYLEYAYSVNGREYTVSETNQFAAYVKQYILPLFDTAATKLNNSLSISGVEEKVREFNNDFFGSKLDLITEYSQYIGGKYYKNYKGIFEKGDYYLSSVVNPNVTAYTTSYASGSGDPYIFMSGAYQNTSTFIHEFGHYVSDYIFGSLTSLDLAEVQSQGNELMFLSYICQNNKIAQNVKKALIRSAVANMTDTIIMGAAINELEQFTYTVDFNKTSLENEWNRIANAYGIGSGYDYLDYMYMVLLNYRGYYISYAVSAVAALQLFAKSLENLDTGKAAYLSICTKNSTNERFKKSLENAGLDDVFSEDAFQLISSLGSII